MSVRLLHHTEEFSTWAVLTMSYLSQSDPVAMVITRSSAIAVVADHTSYSKSVWRDK